MTKFKNKETFIQLYKKYSQNCSIISSYKGVRQQEVVLLCALGTEHQEFNQFRYINDLIEEISNKTYNISTKVLFTRNNEDHLLVLDYYTHKILANFLSYDAAVQYCKHKHYTIL